MGFTKKEIQEAFGVTLLTVDNWEKANRIERIPQTQNGKILFCAKSVREELLRQRHDWREKGQRLALAEKFLGLKDGEDWI